MKIKIKQISYLTIGFVILVLSGCTERDSDQETRIKNLISTIEEEINSKNVDTTKIDSLFQISKSYNYQPGVAKAYSLKGLANYSNGNYAEAKKLFSQAVLISKEKNDFAQLGIDYENLAKTYNRFLQRDSSVYYFKKSAEVRKEIDDSTGIGTALNNAGYIFWRETQYDSAIVYFEKSLAVREKLPNKEHLASTTNNLGTIYYQWAIYDKALEYYYRSLKLNKEIANDKGTAINLVNIGLVYKEISNFDKSVEYFKEGLPFAITSNDSETISYVYNSLGSTYLQNQQDSSIYFFNKSLDLYTNIGSSGGKIIALKGIAQNHMLSNNLKKAKEYFNQILKIAEKENIPLRIAEANMFLGEISLNESNYEQAKIYFEKCIELSLVLNLNSYLRDSYKSLSRVYEELENTDLALDFLRKYDQLNFEINNEDTKRRIDDLKSKFEFERYQRILQTQKYENEKQRIYLLSALILLVMVTFSAVILFRMYSKRNKTNNLLQRKNELIEGQSYQLETNNKELVELNEAKDKLFSIIAHDLKNPFSTLLNYSYFLKEEYHDLSENERIEFVSYMYDTTTKTYELLENLLNLSASRTGRISFNPMNINLSEVIEKIVSLFSLQIKNKFITLNDNISKEHIIFADLYMIEIIFRNLINNAIKYTSNNGVINLSSEKNGDKILISIEDSGVGMDSQTVKNIFNINVTKSQAGTKGEKGTGLGLGLCKEFAEKNNGAISVKSEVNKGSIFTVTLPNQYDV